MLREFNPTQINDYDGGCAKPNVESASLPQHKTQDVLVWIRRNANSTDVRAEAKIPRAAPSQLRLKRNGTVGWSAEAHGTAHAIMVMAEWDAMTSLAIAGLSDH